MQSKTEALTGRTLSNEELIQVSGGASGRAMAPIIMHNPPEDLTHNPPGDLVLNTPGLQTNAMVPPDPY